MLIIKDILYMLYIFPYLYKNLALKDVFIIKIIYRNYLKYAVKKFKYCISNVLTFLLFSSGCLKSI